jgi:hypothetical protein
MSVDFITREFYFMPRVGGGLSGTYEKVPVEGVYYITDTPGPLPPPYYKPLPLPTWMPRKVFITAIEFAYAANVPLDIWQGWNEDERMAECHVWIDPKGIAYNSSNGAEEGSEFTRDITLWHHFTHERFVARRVDHPKPVLWNRDAGDKLLISTAHGFELAWLYCGMQFLVPTPSQPTAVGPGY